MNHVESFLEVLKNKYPYYARVPYRLYKEGDAEYLAFAEMVTSQLLQQGKEAEQVVEAYAQMSTDYLRLQKELEETGRYHYQTFEEAKRHVYDNEKVMRGYYLDGLILSQIWWPNHYRIYRFFIDVFLNSMPETGLVCEVGPGHGLFTATFLRNKPNWRLLAYDTSEFSIAYTSNWISHTPGTTSENYSLIHEYSGEGMKKRGDQFDSIICGEVLEHLEDPLSFLRNLIEYAKPEAVFYLTTAMYAANIDHLYLFHSADEVRELINESGLQIIEEEVLPVNESDSINDTDVPMNYVCTARIQ
ncbi:MAG: class I SAM-dependent methyltransferase [Verrucomicrobiales bacterium]|nr:class I SAM-dependent methyltransferase [Verrucomicrobiales bacterium]